MVPQSSSQLYGGISLTQPGRIVRPQPTVVDPFLTLVKLRVAALLRDNMVNVFGSIINKPHTSLSLDLYAALYDIYQATRLRRIRASELIHVLDRMARVDIHSQFLLLFTELEKMAPKYLTVALSTWLRALRENKVPLYQIIRLDGGVNFLEGIEPSLLRQLRYPLYYPGVMKGSLCFSLGKLLCDVARALRDGSMRISQPLLACLLLHLPVSTFLPEVEEATRYISDVLFENRTSLEFSIQNIGQKESQDLYEMGRLILKELSSQPGAPKTVRETSGIVMEYLRKPSYQMFNHNFERMSPIVKGKDTDYNTLFKVITRGEYPQDVLEARDIILAALINKTINLELALKGFVRHDYTRPEELLIAIIDRIRRRVEIPIQLVDTLNLIHVHLKLKFAAFTGEVRPNRGISDLTMIFDTFKSPGIPDTIGNHSREILKGLREEPIDWSDIFNKFPKHENTRPRQLVVTILSHLSAVGQLSIQLGGQLKEFLRLLDENGEVRNCPVVSCPSPILPIADNLNVDDLLGALGPEAVNEPKFSTLKNYLNGGEMPALLGPEFKFSTHRTNGELLKAILEHISPKNPYMKDVLSYWARKVLLEGVGAKPVRYTMVTKTVDLTNVSKALDHSLLTKEVADRFYSFLSTATRDPSYAESFEMDGHITRGPFLRAFLEHVLTLKITDPRDREMIGRVIPYIRDTGEGAEPIDIDNVVYE
uniref:Uncharacterized protein n=1 Tax=Timema bartmani TaxID=61472 RepID=A0A7R9F2A6_9NEOP|nr:unnamed protein product [Timema bartmani]